MIYNHSNPLPHTVEHTPDMKHCPKILKFAVTLEYDSISIGTPVTVQFKKPEWSYPIRLPYYVASFEILSTNVIKSHSVYEITAH